MSRSPRGRSALLATSAVVLISAAASPAGAHVSVAPAEARGNASLRLAFQVPHGCGSAATTALRVQIPEGVISVKPMPKPGWTLTTTKGDYAKTYQSHGRSLTSGVKEIVWAGGTLPDDQYDEFVISGFVTADLPAGQPVSFPVIQQCGTTEARWTEIPAAGQSAHDLKSPAPAFRLIADTTVVGQVMDHGSHGAKATADAAAAGTAKVGDIAIKAAWTRATPGGAKIGGGYLSITNGGASADRLIGATAAVAGRVEIHEMSMDGGVMKMRPLDKGLEIKPGETVDLRPGGYHMMFMDLKQPLKEGDTVKATLTFEKAGAVDVSFSVNAVGAGSAAPSAAPMQHKH
jgi:uncharacterized protein YcnI/copper(I)-binding protein